MRFLTAQPALSRRVTPACLLAFALFLAGALPASGITLLSWSSWTDTSNPYAADVAATGFSGSITQVGSNDARINASFGSSDGTFGSAVTGAPITGSSMLVRLTTTNTLNFTLTNNSGQDYFIDTFNFDFAPREDGNATDFGFNAFTLTYVSGGLGPASTQIDSQSGLTYVIVGSTNAISDYPDYSYTLSTFLADRTLANGESATFSLVFSGQTGANGGNVSSVLDNIAITGTAVPEPGTLALLLLAGVLLKTRRR